MNVKVKFKLSKHAVQNKSKIYHILTPKKSKLVIT